MNFSIYDFTSFTQWIDKFLYDNLPAFWAIVVEMTIIGLVVLISGGGALLYFWGKNYMSRA